MAGGEGKRLYPFTKILPKPLMPIGEKPIIETIIEKFISFGCTRFFLSLNYKADMIKAYFKDTERGYRIQYVQEKKPLGTIGSLSMLTHKLPGTFFLTNCDIIIDSNYHDIITAHRNAKSAVTVVSSMKHYTIPYGVCQLNQKGLIKDIHEKPKYDFLVNTGMYVIEPRILKYIPVDKEYQMTDLLQECIRKGEKVSVYPISAKSWMDMGQWEEYKNIMKKIGIVI
jgi:NDP-sugar pyrophosphorylase family protein